jgi:hypothetical protein
MIFKVYVAKNSIFIEVNLNNQSKAVIITLHPSYSERVGAAKSVD